LRDVGFHKNETVYLLKERERFGSFYKHRERFGSFYKQNIFLER